MKTKTSATMTDQPIDNFPKEEYHHLTIVMVATQSEMVEHLMKITELVKGMTGEEMKQEILFENSERIKIKK